MKNRARLRQRPRQALFSRIQEFRGGSGSNLSQTKTNNAFAETAINLLQVKEGVWRTRPGTGYYGSAIAGIDQIEGAAQYVTSSGTRELIAICKEGSVSYCYRSQDNGDTWAKVSPSITFTTGKYYQFLQYQSRLYIVNGSNKLTYYDGTQLVRATLVSNPSSAPTGARTTLTAGSYNNSYVYVAVNTVGKTLASPALSITTNKHREQWSGTEKVTLTLTAVPGATGYMVFWGETATSERLIGTTTTTTFEDFGDAVLPVNNYVEVPLVNDTDGPIFKRMELSGNRLWGLSSDNLVMWAGVGSYFGSFSPFYGGGYTEIEKGSKNTPTDILHYRSGKGDPILTVLCGSPNGDGVTYQVELSSTTIGTTAITFPVVYQIVGSTGSNCPQANVKVADDVMFPNTKGIYSLRNKEQLFNVLATTNMIQVIRDRWETLNNLYKNKVFAYFSDPYVYFTFPTTSSENDTTIVYNKETRNWSSYWTLGFRAMFEFTDNTNSATTHVILVPNSGTRLVELSEDYVANDLGVPFYQVYVSQINKVSEDYTTKGKPRQAIVELGDFIGTCSYEFLGETAKRALSVVASRTINASVALYDVFDDFYSDFYYSDSNTETERSTPRTQKAKLNIGKKIYSYQHKISSSNSNTRFEILGFQVKGIAQPSRAPSGWS